MRGGGCAVMGASETFVIWNKTKFRKFLEILLALILDEC